MEARSHVEDMLHDLGREVGASLAFDGGGLCVLELGDDQECLISMPPASQAVAFCVNVVPVVVTDRQAFFTHLLTLNFTDELTQGAALGLDEGATEVVARYTMPAERLQPGDLSRIVTNLAELGVRLRTELTAWQEAQLQAGPTELAAPGQGQGRPLLPTDLV